MNVNGQQQAEAEVARLRAELATLREDTLDLARIVAGMDADEFPVMVPLARRILATPPAPAVIVTCECGDTLACGSRIDSSGEVAVPAEVRR